MDYSGSISMTFRKCRAKNLINDAIKRDSPGHSAANKWDSGCDEMNSALFLSEQMVLTGCSPHTAVQRAQQIMVQNFMDLCSRFVVLILIHRGVKKCLPAS